LFDEPPNGTAQSFAFGKNGTGSLHGSSQNRLWSVRPRNPRNPYGKPEDAGRDQRKRRLAMRAAAITVTKDGATTMSARSRKATRLRETLFPVHRRKRVPYRAGECAVPRESTNDQRQGLDADTCSIQAQ
jgi:hypothetical protein